MFEITTATAPVIYLFLVVIAMVILLIWRGGRKRKLRPLLDGQILCLCEFCHYSYLVPRHYTINRCPCCHCLNKANSYRAHMKKQNSE